MLFFVISTPRRSRATTKLIEARLAFRKWLKSLGKRVVCFYPREDRGSVVVFNVGSRRELHIILRDWRTFVHARLDVHPLQDPVQANKHLSMQLHQLKRKE